ncbi:MAG: hypothetical protein AAF466_01885 [Bacteroidota bacterium]
MIKFFRTIRRRLLSSGKMSNYFLYALGEIALVMVGILLALQVNNWNSERLQRKEIRTKYERLKGELESTSTSVKRKANLIDSLLITSNQRSLELLVLRNEDSIQRLHESLEAITKVITVSYDMPATSEFLQAGYLSSIDNERIKTLLLNLRRSISFGTVVDDYAKNQLNTLIEPYVIQHINYAQMVKGRSMKVVNPTTDFTVFFDDLQLENLLNLKIETDITKIDYLRTFSTLLDRTIEEIDLELKEKE